MLAALVLAVDDDEVAGLEDGGDGGGELLRGEDRREDLQADVGGEQEGEGCGDERRDWRRGVCSCGGGASWRAAPPKSAMAATMSGSRKAAMAWVLRSRKWPKERA